jgi:hypothetical protein
MAEQKILSFRASDEVLTWISKQAEPGETPSKALQRILNKFAAEDAVNTVVNDRVNEIVQAPQLISVDDVNEIVDARIQARMVELKAEILGELAA